jgi:hypothetical protein
VPWYGEELQLRPDLVEVGSVYAARLHVAFCHWHRFVRRTQMVVVDTEEDADTVRLDSEECMPAAAMQHTDPADPAEEGEVADHMLRTAARVDAVHGRRPHERGQKPGLALILE